MTDERPVVGNCSWSFSANLVFTRGRDFVIIEVSIRETGKGGELHVNDRKEKKGHSFAGRLFVLFSALYLSMGMEKWRDGERERRLCRYMEERTVFCDGAGKYGRNSPSPFADALGCFPE
ncbi:MAG: hypothetical protein ACLR2E_06715 [Lachnospiraceae bacterium]